MVNRAILFIVDRNVYYRHYGPFIEYLAGAGHSIHILHDYSQSRVGVKKGYFPDLFSVPQFSTKISFIGLFNTTKDIISYVRSNNIDYVFSLNSYIQYGIHTDQIQPCKWVVLQNWADNFQHGPKEVFNCDHFLSYSKLWWDCFLKSDYNNNKSVAPQKIKIHHIGHPLNFLIEELDVKHIKKKYNLPMDRKVLTYLPIGPANMYGFQNIFQKLWLVTKYSSLPHKISVQLISSLINLVLFRSVKTLVDEKLIILAIKRFCKNNDFTFIVKTRFKSVHSQFLLDHVDHLFFDESFYPPTISELVFISDITVSHFSMATFEAIAMKSFKININLEPVFDIFTNHFSTLFGNDWIDDFNKQGLGSIINGSDFINKFADSNYKEFQFNEKHYNDFMLKYFSETDPQMFHSTLDKLISGDFDDVKEN